MEEYLFEDPHGKLETPTRLASAPNLAGFAIGVLAGSIMYLGFQVMVEWMTVLMRLVFRLAWLFGMYFWMLAVPVAVILLLVHIALVWTERTD